MTPEQLTLQAVIVWAAGISTIANMLLLLWNIFSGPSRKNGARLDALSANVAAVEQRVSVIDQLQRALPSKDDMHELEITMTGLRGELATMTERLAGHASIMNRLEASVARHEDHLMKKS